MESEIIRKSGKLYKEGKSEEAKALLIQYIKRSPADTDAWYALSFCVDDLSHKQKCLEQILKIDSRHQRACAALEQIKNQENPFQKAEAIVRDRSEKRSAHEVMLKEERKKAGESTVQMGNKRRKKGLSIGIVAIAILSILTIIISNPERFGISGGAILVLLLVFFFCFQFIEKYTNRKSKEANRAYRGARAEEKIGRMLESLGNGYEVLHDVEYPYGNIDHVVVSETGTVFMIETKSHGGKVSFSGKQVLVNGKNPEKDFITQSLRNTYWLRDEISTISGETPWVTAILVFTKAYVPYMKPIKGVHVVNKKFLLKTIKTSSKTGTSNPKIMDKLQEIIEALSR